MPRKVAPRPAPAAAPSSGGGIHLDIPGVEPDTKVGELTVEQFVQLVVQLRQQLGGRPAADRRRAEMTAKFIRILASDNEDVAALKRAFGDIGRKLPAVLLDLARELGKGEP